MYYRLILLLLLWAAPFGASSYLASLLAEDLYSGGVNVSFNGIPTTDPNALYDAVLNGRKNVQALLDRVTELNVTITNETLLDQADTLRDRLSAINDTIYSVSEKFTVLQSNFSSVKTYIDQYTSILSCFANKGCVTDVPTSPATTLPTCVSTRYNSTTAVQRFQSPGYPALIYNAYDCVEFIDAAAGYEICVQIEVMINGSARLYLNNSATSENLKLYDTSTTEANFTNTGTNTLDVHASVGGTGTDGIAFNISFQSKDLCEGVDCHNGTCIVEEATNKPLCKCNTCFSDGANGFCTTGIDPCNAIWKKKCKQKCVKAPGDTCLARCDCNSDGTLTLSCA